MHARPHQPAGTVHHQVAGAGPRSFGNQRSDAACTIAALFDLDPVGVEDAIEHSRVGPARWLEHQRLVEADPGMSVGELAEGFGVGERGFRRGVEDDEIVSGSMHLHELDPHVARIPEVMPSWRKTVGVARRGENTARVRFE